MIVCVGASASGKTELAKELYKTYGYKKCVTTTTRDLRQNEEDGIDYHFLSKSDFLTLVDKDAFFEVTMYNQHLYGIQKKDVFNHGMIIVDPSGANKLIDQLKNDVFVVFVSASEQTRRNRMIARGDEEEVIEKRIIQDRDIFIEENLSRIDLSIINEDKKIEDLAKIVNQAYKKHLKS
ncbi:MAG: AAA family ATPase [Acholeplasmataceae bacterium]